MKNTKLGLILMIVFFLTGLAIRPALNLCRDSALVAHSIICAKALLGDKAAIEKAGEINEQWEHEKNRFHPESYNRYYNRSSTDKVETP